MKIGVILERVNPVIGEAVEILRSRGAAVELIQPRQMNFELSEIRIRHDLYVIKSIAMPMAASYAATVHALGASTFNPFPVVQMIRNKIVTMRLLADHGVPIPETYVGVDYEFLVPLLEHGPMIVKPFMGSRGIGVQRVTNRNELKIAAGDIPPIFAQRFYASDDGLDHKITHIGGKIFGVKRIFPLRTYADKSGTPFEVDDETREIATKIKNALTIDMFTFDLIVSNGKSYVVDVGAFGSLMGVPNAPSLVAERITQAWEEREQ
jgi:glutathione synthase/RimK-type ligase-like ATP-grasp enzyme